MALTKIPNFIVHYNRSEPFRSITSLADAEVASLVKQLTESCAWGLARFSDPTYLAQRREIESWMRQRFSEMGGRPELENPIYFFLGRHKGFEQDGRNIAYRIDLQKVDPSLISFSYGDSMFCFHEQNRRMAGEKYQNPLCEQLYSMETLARLVVDPRFPASNSLAIEAHLWANPWDAYEY